MRELIGKIGRLCENHVEKIVLVVAGIISVWLFITGVLISPDVVKYENKNVSVVRIDELIAQKLDELRTAKEHATSEGDASYKPRLTGPVDPNDPVLTTVGHRPQPKSFLELFRTPLAFLGTPAKATGPVLAAQPGEAGTPRYRLPAIPRLTNVGIEYLRAAAYVPQGDVTMERPYAAAQSQVEDIDLVTVEAKFDIVETYRQFREYFNGSEVQKADWRDPCLAVPKFAALQLQRQEILDTGLWSDWTAVAPNRVCPYKQLFQVIENVKDLPVGGIDIRMTTYNDIWTTMALLQPESYQIASADERWFPPSFYDRFKKIQRQLDVAERTKEREDARNQAATTTGAGSTTTRGQRGDSARSNTTTTGGRGTQSGRATQGGRGSQGNDNVGGNYGGGRGGRNTTGGRGNTNTADGQTGRGGRQTTARTGRTGVNDPQVNDPQNPANQGPSVAEVEIDFLNMQIVPGKTNLAQLKEPMLVWQIDDTVVPGRTYRYRMRIGVFNPVAGTGRVAERDAARKDQVILWSDFTPVTNPVTIYRKIYVFAKDVQERTHAASIEVARYLRGYWRTEDFQVQPGETIGKEVETKKDRREKKAAAEASRITAAGLRGGNLDAGGLNVANLNLGLGAGEETDEMNPPTIDFSTGMLLVDLVPVNDWSAGPNAKARTYYDMLYTEDGSHILHMPAGAKNWPKALSEAYQFVNSSAAKEKKPLRAFGPTTRGADPRSGSAARY